MFSKNIYWLVVSTQTLYVKITTEENKSILDNTVKETMRSK